MPIDQDAAAPAPVAERIKPLQLMPETIPGFGNAASFELIQRAARMLSAGKMVPKMYQEDVASCAIALNIALRMGADPLMVMQNLYVVSGKPGWSSAFLIATFNSTKAHGFGPLRYEFSGDQTSDLWSCRAWAIDRESGTKIYGTTISMKMAKAEGWYGKDGSKWKTMPEQMLMYRAAAFFIRVYAPEISLGLQTVDELQDAFEAVPDGQGGFSVVASAGRHPGGDAAAAAVSPVPADPHRKETLTAQLMIKAEEGVESLEMEWAFMDEDARLLVGMEGFDRIKKLAADKEKTKGTAPVTQA